MKKKNTTPDDAVVENEIIAMPDESLVDLSDERTHEDDVEFDEKPEWGMSIYHELAPYRHSMTVDHGPQVAYVNRLFGIPGDKFTKDTVAEVRAWQARKGLQNTGFLTFDEYNQL